MSVKKLGVRGLISGLLAGAAVFTLAPVASAMEGVSSPAVHTAAYWEKITVFYDLDRCTRLGKSYVNRGEALDYYCSPEADGAWGVMVLLP